VSLPWLPQGAKIAAAALNASGGIMGHPVQIVFCDDMYTPQAAGVCAQKLLVTDKVLMLVGGDGTQDAAVIPVLNAANTIDWGDFGSSQASYESPQVFMLGPLQVSAWVLPQMLPPTTKHLVYVTAVSPIAAISEQQFAANLPKSIQLSTVTIPLTATAMETPCLQMKNTGADTVNLAPNPSQASTIITACYQLGLTNLLWAITMIEISPDVIQVVDSNHVKNLVYTEFSGTALDGLASDAAKYGPQVGGITNILADDAVETWLAVKLVPEVIAGAGALNGAAIKAWLDQQTAFNTQGATPPINFAATPLPKLPRLKNLSAWQATIQNGKVVQTVNTPFIYHPPTS
jgi:branched-chain amino acid transport system substrate-binding protein